MNLTTPAANAAARQKCTSRAHRTSERRRTRAAIQISLVGMAVPCFSQLAVKAVLVKEARALATRLSCAVFCENPASALSMSRNRPRTTPEREDGNDSVEVILAAPFSELLPGLDQFLEGARSRKCAAVDDAAVAIGALVKVEDSAGAEVGEIFAEFFEMFAGQSIVALSHVRTAGHDLEILSDSSFVRLSWVPE